MTPGRVILSVSPFACDHESVHDGAGACTCRVVHANTLAEARRMLTRLDICLVVCERDLPPGTWVDLFEQLRERPNPPLLIVTSRLADDRLWAEALNLGAWDVVAKPFVAHEIATAIEQAWSHWSFQQTRIDCNSAGRSTE